MKIFDKNWKIFLLLGFMVGGVYVNILNNGFVWDDSVFVYDWQAIKKPFENTNELLFSLPYKQTNFRPVKNAFYALNYALWGENPAGYHATAIVMHIINVWLVWLVAEALLKNKKAAFVAASIFALHPVNVEAVAWITANMDTLGHTFFLLSFYSFMRFRRSKNLKWKMISITAAGAAFLTNELTFSLGVIIPVYDLIVEKVNLKNNKKILLDWVAYVLLIAGYFGLKWFMVGAGGSELGVGKLPIGIISLARYLRFLVLPFGLTVNHQVWNHISGFYQYDLPYPDSVDFPNIWEQEVVASVFVVLVVLALGWRFGKVKSTTWFLVVSTLITFLPVVQFVPTTALFAERYMYLASVFFGILCGFWWDYWVKRDKKNLVVKLVLPIALMCSYALISVKRNDDWQSKVSLWTQAVSANPESGMNHDNLGKAYLDVKNLEQAKIFLEKSVELNPNYPISLINLGAVYNLEEKYGESLKLYKKATELNPELDAAHNGMAVSYLGLGEYDKSREIAGGVLKNDPNNKWAYLVLAKNYHKQFVYNQAESNYLKVLELDNKNIDAMSNLGNLYLDWGKTDEAKKMYELVLEMDGENEEVKSRLEVIKKN